MSLTIKPATRQGVKPLIGLYSESGCGKTYSALLLARGLVGPNGKIVMVDTESGRGSLYADVLSGGYDVLELRDSFSPKNYIEAIKVVEQSGALIGIIDSASHEWEGLDGVLDMAGKIEEKKGKGLHCWNQPKMEHAKFMLSLLQSAIPWVVCLRAKYKTRQIKNNGKTEIVKDDFTTPIQADDFIFEMTAHAEILHDHSIRLTKCSHPSLKGCFPDKGPITIQTGEAIAKWCLAPGGSAAAVQKEESADALKKKLWKLTTAKHNGDKDKLRQWLTDEAILDPELTLEELDAAALKTIYIKAEQKLAA